MPDGRPRGLHHDAPISLLPTARYVGFNRNNSPALPQGAIRQVGNKPPVVAVLVGNRAVLDWVLAGMRDLGYVAERDFRLEARLTDGIAYMERKFADEIVAWHPECHCCNDGRA